MAKLKYPQSVYLYVCDYDTGGHPIFAVVEKIDEIPEESHNDLVAYYTFDHVGKFVVDKVLSVK